MVYIRGLVGSVALLIGLAGCSAAPSPWTAGKSPKVLTSFPPLYCFAANLVTDDAQVMSLLTAVGPHDYKIGSHDPLKVREADLFFINGLSLDDTFTARLRNSSVNPGLRYVDVSEAIPKDRLRPLSKEEREQEHDGHTHAHGMYDPHVWLGIPEAIHIVHRLRDELKKADPGRADKYDTNAANYVKRLEKLQEDGKALLAHVPHADRQIVTMHDSLFYFARTFNLEIVGSIQPRAGVDLNPNELEKLVERCKTKKVHVVTVEPQYPESAARTLCNELAKQTGVEPQKVMLDPLETAEEKELNADWYETKMRENLKRLADALR